MCFGRIVTATYLLGEGLLNQSWWINSSNGRYILRVSRPERLWEQVAYEHTLIRALYNHSHVLVAPLPGYDGDTVQQWHSNILSLFPQVDGTSISFGEPDTDPHVFFRSYLGAGGPLTADDFELLGGFARMGMPLEAQWT